MCLQKLETKREYLQHIVLNSKCNVDRSREALIKIEYQIENKKKTAKLKLENKLYKQENNKYKTKYLGKPIEKLDKQGNVLERYLDLYNLQERDYNIIPSCVARCCEGIQKVHSDYMWRFA